MKIEMSSSSIAISERLGIGPDVRELKLGRTFAAKDSNAFHTIRYDFKPASVDLNKTAKLELNENNKVTVIAPNVEGSGSSETVFKGSRKPHQKECVLIIDHDTGEITLERLSQNIIVKRTRQGNTSKTPAERQNASQFESRKSLPQQKPNSPPPKSQISPNNKHKTLSPPKANGQYYSQQQQQHRSPGQPISPSMPTLSALSNINPSTSTSLSTKRDTDKDMLGLSDSSSDSSDHESNSSSSSTSTSSSSSSDEEEDAAPPANANKVVTSSSSGSSDSDSDNEEPPIRSNEKPRLNNGTTYNNATNGSIGLSMPKFSQLSEDLRLSESGSDSDD